MHGVQRIHKQNVQRIVYGREPSSKSQFWCFDLESLPFLSFVRSIVCYCLWWLWFVCPIRNDNEMTEKRKEIRNFSFHSFEMMEKPDHICSSYLMQLSAGWLDNNNLFCVSEQAQTTQWYIHNISCWLVVASVWVRLMRLHPPHTHEQRDDDGKWMEIFNSETTTMLMLIIIIHFIQMPLAKSTYRTDIVVYAVVLAEIINEFFVFIIAFWTVSLLHTVLFISKVTNVQCDKNETKMVNSAYFEYFFWAHIEW